MIRRGLRAAWLSLFLLACTAPVQALQLETVADGLTDEEAAASHALLTATSAYLPGKWAQALDRVPVQWRDDLPADVHGRAIGGRILLKRGLLHGWLAGAPAIAGDRKAAVATLIHELAHLYDRTGAGRLSRDARLRDLAGWQVAALRPGRTRNAFTDRTPDAYELEDPGEFVAVNLEHFLLDASYACRRPALYRHFAAHFGMESENACADALPFVQADTRAGSDPLLLLDPARVYAVDYLLAEGNAQPMSRWGHSMLRLVVCAPGRAPGPDCRLDLAHHRVLSFRAFVDDVQVSSWRGLTGSYPSRLFLLPLDQVIEEYTRIELRGLQSIPLRLRRDEIATLLERAAQVHWSYDGRYYFVSNNCAFETYKLLHDGVPRLADDSLASITPTGLLRRLQRAELADASVLDERAEAMRLGYYFESMADRYESIFAVAREALGLPQADVREWIEADPQARSPWIARADLRTSAALLLLEQAALRRQELRARDELKRRLLARSGSQLHAAARTVLQWEDLLTRPAQVLGGDGYGLPQASEWEAATDRIDALATLSREQRAALLAEAKHWLHPRARAALEATEANAGHLAARLRQLHQEQGGLQLP